MTFFLRTRLNRRCYKIGVEICSHQLRYVILQVQGPLWTVVKADSIDFQPDHLTAWKKLGKYCESYNREIVLGLGLNDVLIKQYQIANELSADEIYLYLQKQAQNLLSLQRSELALDFEILKLNIDPKKISVRMIAARKELITELQHYCQQVGLIVSAIDMVVLALKRLLTLIALKNYCAIVLLEEKFLIYSVIRDKEIFFIKQIDYSLTVLSDEMNFDTMEAGIIKAQQFYMSQYQQKVPSYIYYAGSLADTVFLSFEKYSELKIVAIQLNTLFEFDSDVITEQISHFLGPISLAL
jgi:Tfp pilus assembly PilM family ATPase